MRPFSGYIPETSFWFRPLVGIGFLLLIDPARAAVPDIPTSPAATPVSTTQIDFTWTHTGVNVTKFTVGKSRQGANLWNSWRSYFDPSLRKYTEFVCPGTTMWFGVTAGNDEGNSAIAPVPPATVSATTPQGVPGAGPNTMSFIPTAVPNVGLKVVLHAHAPVLACNATKYYVERSVNGIDFGPSIGSFDVTDAQWLDYEDTTVQANVTYYYRMRGWNSFGYGPYGVIAGPVALTAPPQPVWRLPRLTSTTQILLSWIDGYYLDGTQLETGYEVWRSTSATPGSGTRITTTAQNAESYTDTPGPQQTYYYYLKAVNQIGTSSASPMLPVTLGLPAAHQNLQVTSDGLYLQLTWTDGANNEDGTLVERCNAPNDCSPAGTGWATLNASSPVPPLFAEWTDNVPSPTTIYSYRVWPKNVFGNGPKSNIASGSVTGGGGTPSPPSNLRVVP